jgi:CRISPR system Cascade subunit CasA
MNLLTDTWIPIQQSGVQEKITLQQLLCGDKTGELCLPRDDMELACLQLLVAITQVLFMPENKKELINYIKNPISEDQYINACKNKMDWFDLNHPKTPFMQFRGVASVEPTPMNKLLAGVADGTNKTLVNPVGLADGLCGSCAAIALFNMANNCPSMGGGFKGSLRGSTPITVMIKGRYLKETIWLNVLNKEILELHMPWFKNTQDQAPNYVSFIKAGDNIPSSQLGLERGLLWQAAKFELLDPMIRQACSCCGCNEKLYTSFNKAKFNYTIDGTWPHPLSSRMFEIKKGKKVEKFISFTTAEPTWRHMSRLVVDIQGEKAGHTAAPVIQQAKELRLKKLDLIIGGYRNNQATILERRHEIFSLAQGWEKGGTVVYNLISGALEYKKALRKSLYLFAIGIKDKINGAGINLCEPADASYFQLTESLIHETLANINFEQPDFDIQQMNKRLKRIVNKIFDQFVEPYQQEPKMLKALALARRSLQKSLKDLEPEQHTVSESQTQEVSHAQ